MPRPGLSINRILPSDTKAFRLLWNTEHVPRDLLEIGDRRLRTYVSMGLVKQCVNTKNESVIMCTSKGRDYISKLPDFAGRSPYISSSACNHNCELAKVYTALPEEQQKQWVTEREILNMCRDRLDDIYQQDFGRWLDLTEKEMSPCDGGVMNLEGRLEVMYEIITDNYGNLDSKEVCGQILETNIEYTRV